MKNNDKVLEIWILLVGLGYLVAAIVLFVSENVGDKFFERFFFSMFCLSVYAILRKL